MDSAQYFLDYYWKNGIPYGKEIVHCLESMPSYKIVSDPYRKRISIEKYLSGHFIESIYDSILLDFRHLKAAEQHAWQHSSISENESTSTSLIRNQDDRILFKEYSVFEQGFCRKCTIYSPQNILLSVHKMYYERLNDSFNGVILFDVNEHPVMKKKYEVDQDTGEFSVLLEECWDFVDLIKA